MLPFYVRSLHWLALAGLATACAPTYQLGLKPTRATGFFVEGREQAQAVASPNSASAYTKKGRINPNGGKCF